MSDAALTPTTEPQSLEETCPTMHLVARNPQEMAAAQANLATWFVRKIAAVTAEADELASAVEEAKANTWKFATLEGQHARAMTRKLFYEKCLFAVQEGYTIIPDIAIDIFAIRTARTKPARKEQHEENKNYEPHVRVPDERPQVLPPGVGQYQNPETFVHNIRGTCKNEKGEEVKFHTQWATRFDAIEFPAIAAVPYVMNATQEAMAARVFDQIGISPQGSVRSADPLIIGQILGEHRGYSGRKTISFLIAWHLDLRTL